MKTKEITKKLEEVRVKLYDEATSSEEKSPIQVGDDSMLPMDDDLAGEEVKIKRTEGEKVKDTGTQSRVTPMDGKSKVAEKEYITDGTLKGPTMNELQDKLDSIKKVEGEERFTINVNGVSPEVFNSTIEPALQQINTATNGQVFWTDFRQTGENFFFYLVNKPVESDPKTYR
jgi:hypothetical protein